MRILLIEDETKLSELIARGVGYGLGESADA
jgi:hypothetical protein